MTKPGKDAQRNDEAQIFWGLIAILLAGIVAVTLILEFNRLPFPGGILIPHHNSMPAQVRPLHPAATSAPNSSRPSTSIPTASARASVAPGPSSVPSLVTSPELSPSAPAQPVPVLSTPSLPVSTPPLIRIPLPSLPLPKISVSIPPIRLPFG
jgi:hypothetical protein